MFSQDRIIPFGPFLPSSATRNCNHPRKTPNNPINSLKICLQAKLCFSNRKPAMGRLYFVRQHRGLELSVSGTWGINVESSKSAPLKAFSAWIRQNYSEWPQLPLSRFPNFARIQALAILNKQSVALGIQFGLYILTKTVTPWQHFAME